ncbi:Retrovirus-related Pol polyprotein from transposon 17.6, partial [Dictyocoela roeselum]
MHDEIRRDNRKQSINGDYKKSFIINYLLNQTPADEHLILSSKRYGEMLSAEIAAEEQKGKCIAKIDERFEVVNFEYHSAKSGLRILHRLNTLRSIEEQDLINWKACFIEVSRICQWSEEINIEVLTQIVDLSIQVQIGNTINSADMLNKIMKLKYNSYTAYEYQRRLANIKQSDFHTIRAYIVEIESNVQKVGICLDWNKDMIKAKIEEIFFAGLHERVKFELIKSSNRTFDHCFRILADMDQLCLEKIRYTIERANTRNPIKKSGNFKKERPNVKVKRYASNNEYKDTKPKGSNKYCHFHKSRTHSDHECRANKNTTQSNNRTFTLREPRNAPKTIEIPFRIKDHTLISMIDTGSTDNIIPQNIVETEGLQQVALERKKIVEVANGSTVEIKNYCDINFQILNDKNITYKSRFLVMPNNSDIIILGMKFLIDNEAILNLKEGIMNLDGKEYEIETNSTPLNVSDTKIISKTKIFATKTEERDLMEAIKNAKQRNPELGEIDTISHKIELTKTFSNLPKEYRVPMGLQHDVKEHLKELEKLGIIEERECDMISPAFIIKKKNGKLRLVVDYRYMNSITKKIHQITPNLYELLASLKGAKIFSTIDLNNGYYQIKIDEDDLAKTGFVIMNKTYVFRRMPFGLSNAPATFQKAMYKILENIEVVVTYMDDILLFSTTMKEHILLVDTVLQKLIDSGVSINFEKCAFAKKETEFLGHRINEDGISPIISKLEIYEGYEPKTKKQLQKLLGFIKWFRPFVKNLSLLTADLYAKLKSDKKTITWNEADKQRIQEIISKIKNHGILHHPDLNKEFTLRCDASDVGMRSVLLQDGKVIGFYSKKYNVQEKNYTTSEKEIYSVLKSVEHFNPLIYHTKINIETDNKNITFNGEISKRIHRWKLLLEEYDYFLRHIKGEENSDADALSRYFLKTTTKNHNNNLPIFPDINTQNESQNDKAKYEISENENNKEDLMNFFRQIHVELIHPGIIIMEKTLRRYVKMRGMKRYLKKV